MPFFIARFPGHKSTVMTKRYAHLAPEHLSEEMNRVEKWHQEGTSSNGPETKRSGSIRNSRPSYRLAGGPKGICTPDLCIANAFRLSERVENKGFRKAWCHRKCPDVIRSWHQEGTTLTSLYPGGTRPHAPPCHPYNFPTSTLGNCPGFDLTWPGIVVQIH